MGIYVGNKRYAPYIGDKRRRYMGGGGGSLPYDAEIEYLETTRTQYINTEIIGTNNTGFYMKFVLKEYSNNPTIGFILRPPQFGVCVGLANEGRRFMIATNAWKNTGIVCELDTEYEVSFNYENSKKTIINQTSFDYPTDITSPQKSIRLLQRYEVNGSFLAKSDYGFIGRIYSNLIITDESNVVFNAIPVRVGTTGYLYDKISGRLYGNSGTGNFVLGPDKT